MSTATRTTRRSGWSTLARVDIPANVETCVCTECEGSGCHVDLAGLARDVDVLDMDCVKRVNRTTGRICDCAILWRSRRLVAATELKGGQDISIQRLVEQIQGGCNAISDLLNGQTVEDFYPIRMYSGKRDPRRALQGKRVMFRGQPRRVMVAPCGSRLSTIVGESIRKRSPKRR